MHATTLFKSILRQALAAIALTGALGSASAGVVVTGDWDPAIGGPFNLLGWRGQAQFDVPAACLVAGPVSVSSSDPCLGNGGSLIFLGATVQFYPLADLSLPSGAPTVDTVVFGTGALTVNSIDVLNGKVTRVTSDYTVFQPTFSGSAFNALDQFGFALRFDSAFDATLVYGSKGIEGGFDGSPASNEQAGNFAQAPVVYTTPEPGTLALVAGAAALAFRARQRA
jgi:hypothetical protein